MGYPVGGPSVTSRAMAKASKRAKPTFQESSESIAHSVYFLSLEVENVLCFKDRQVLDLTDGEGKPKQWTVILGDNGVGKTTLLRCLAGMEMGVESDSSNVEFYWPMLDGGSLAEDWVNQLVIAVEKLDKVPSLAAKVICDGVLSASNSQIRQVNWEANIDLPIGGGVISYSLPDGYGAYLVCYGYGAIRNLSKVSLAESLESPNSLSLFSEGISLINAEEWLLQTDYAAWTASGNLRGRLEHQLSQIIEILKRILPDIEDIRIAPADEENPRPRAEFLTPYGWVHINSLGLGYRTAIAWMVDLAVRLFRRYPQSADPLAEPAIVLVDEIDLHLHPKWQRTIMDFLSDRFPNTQFIVTAHSPLVVQAAQDANIVLLRREGDRVVIDNDPEIIRNWRVDQVLTSVFELPTSRPPQIESALHRREEILSKAHLTAEDEAELSALTQKIGSLPTAESIEDIEAMDIIRRAAQLINQA
jgi:energy-coupling factor transporter ATP-binding protein EcfA2